MKRMTLSVVIFLLYLGTACGQTAAEKKATIAYLRALQTKSGGFLPTGNQGASGRLIKPSLRATTAAVRALKYFGGEVPDLQAAARFVESCFDSNKGGFVDSQPTLAPDVFSTAVGIMAVVELKMPAEKYTEKVVKFLDDHAGSFEDIRIAAAGLESAHAKASRADDWLKQTTRLRNDDGTYGKGSGAARSTAGAIGTVLRLGGKVKHREQVLKTLKTGQRKDGGFGQPDADGSDLETCYRVMRAFVMLKEKPARAADLRKFVAKCRNADGGYGIAPGKPSQVGATYFASIILHWVAEK